MSHVCRLSISPLPPSLFWRAPVYLTDVDDLDALFVASGVEMSRHASCIDYSTVGALLLYALGIDCSTGGALMGFGAGVAWLI